MYTSRGTVIIEKRASTTTSRGVSTYKPRIQRTTDATKRGEVDRSIYGVLKGDAHEGASIAQTKTQ